MSEELHRYRVRFTCNMGNNCVTRFYAENRDQALAIAKTNYGAVKIHECWHEHISSKFEGKQHPENRDISLPPPASQ